MIWTLAIVAVVMAVAAGGATLRPDFALENFFGSDDPA